MKTIINDYGNCRCRLLADSLDIKKIILLLNDEHTEVDRDSSFITLFQAGGIIVFFDFGVCVEWGTEISKKLEKRLKLSSSQSLPPIESENLRFDFAASDRSIDDDKIFIAKNDNFSKIVTAYSFAIGQAHKLSVYEFLISKTIDKSIYIPKELSRRGKINLSNKNIAKLRGELFLIKSDINLGFELLDTPNYFWEHPNEVVYYNEMSNYLELNQRIKILNKKINVVSEILSMLSDEQKHQDSSFLERVIIFLILIEVIIFLFHDIFKLF